MKQLSGAQYPFADIEEKWRRVWREKNLYEIDLAAAKRKLYCLVMFPYPSGEKMHIGQWYNYGPADTWARLKRMQGYDVFFPIGYDAFGLPAENYAIKHGVHPAVSTKANIDFFREQLRQIGAMFDTRAELITSDPSYYKWTQWIFLKLYQNGLAYRKEAPVNWCPKCHTVLANEQAREGKCERCDTLVTRKNLVQWFFKITAYADRLLEGHNRIDWPEKTITMQKNWIGRSEGSEIVFVEEKSGLRLPVFTTRADTLFGVTYLVMAPEHHLVDKITDQARVAEVNDYKNKAQQATEIDRLSVAREKTGVFTGAYAINPINNERLPIWIADYVLASYGTGVVMAVPGHDQRDWEFSQKYNLPIREVIKPQDGVTMDLSKGAYEEFGLLINSGEFDGLDSRTAIERINAKLSEMGSGRKAVSYRLRDWLISRQRYWGAPIPMVFCDNCGEVPVPENELPIVLPEISDFRPTETGESPLARSQTFLYANCPRCKRTARRSTETMDTFVDSSWYFLRYLNPYLDSKPWDEKLVKKWLPVDFYVGGAEHAVMHLMYARFIVKCLFDMKLIDFDEPFLKLRHQGIITNNGAKISKSRGNVINPDRFIEKYGSDTFRCYLMFMGSYSDGGDWDDSGINGVARFLGRIYRLYEKHAQNVRRGVSISYGNIISSDMELRYYLNHAIVKVAADIESLDFNTAIAAMMELLNLLYKRSENGNTDDLFDFALAQYIKMLAPLAPHLAEELWSRTGNCDSVFNCRWPEHDKEALVLDKTTIAVQVNGRLRGTVEVNRSISEEELLKAAKSNEHVGKYLENKEIVREIVVPGKLVNIVVK